MKKAIRIVTGFAKVNAEWKNFAKALRMAEIDIEIVDNLPSASNREKCRQMLVRWQEEKVTKATRRLLVKVLRRCRYNDVAGNSLLYTLTHTDQIQHSVYINSGFSIIL